MNMNKGWFVLMLAAFFVFAGSPAWACQKAMQMASYEGFAGYEHPTDEMAPVSPGFDQGTEELTPSSPGWDERDDMNFGRDEWSDDHFAPSSPDTDKWGTDKSGRENLERDDMTPSGSDFDQDDELTSGSDSDSDYAFPRDLSLGQDSDRH